MNFLSHYFFDSKPNNPLFNYGLIFPDIVRNFVRGTKLNLNITMAELPENEQQLLNGCIKHVNSDKIFHAWTGFHEMMDLVTDHIRGQHVAFKRDWFIAHILSELAMDHFLLRDHKNLATQLYTDFEMVDSAVVHSFLARQNFNSFEQFNLGFDRFMEVKYLQKYDNPENVVFALGKICTKMGIDPLDEHQKNVIMDILVELGKEMPERIEKLQRELHV